MGIGMTAKWIGFTPDLELETAAAEYLVMLSPYGNLLQNCEVVVERKNEDGTHHYRARVFLATHLAQRAGPVHSSSPDPIKALHEAFEVAKSQLDSMLKTRH